MDPSTDIRIIVHIAIRLGRWGIPFGQLDTPLLGLQEEKGSERREHGREGATLCYWEPEE